MDQLLQPRALDEALEDVVHDVDRHRLDRRPVIESVHGREVDAVLGEVRGPRALGRERLGHPERVLPEHLRCLDRSRVVEAARNPFVIVAVAVGAECFRRSNARVAANFEASRRVAYVEEGLNPDEGTCAGP